MQNKTLFEQLSDLPMITNQQEITITSNRDDSIRMPAWKMVFKVSTNTDGKTVIDQGFIALTERKQSPAIEYPLQGAGIYLYHTKNNDNKDQIASVLITDKEAEDDVPIELDMAQKGHAELINFIELARDAEALQAYRSLAFYWTVIQSGIGIITGTQEYEITEEDEYED